MKLIIAFTLFFPVLAFSKTIVFLGDSLTEGYGISKEKSYPSLLYNKLKIDGVKDLKFINGSISGSTTASASSRLDNYIKKTRPNFLALALGGNDGLRGLEPQSIYQNLAKVIEKAQKENIKVILMGLRMAPNYGKDYTKRFEDIYVRLSKKYKITFIPQLLKGVAGVAKLNQEDGIHPNEQGHQKMMENVYSYFKNIL